MNEKYDKSVRALSALSMAGWAFFLLISAADIKKAIAAFTPKAAAFASTSLFWLMVALFFALAAAVVVSKKGDKLAGIFTRLVLGATFVLAAFPKILDPAGFALDISHYDTFPKIFINMIAITMPWIELFMGLSLIFAVAEAGGVLLVNLIMAAFLVLLAQAWYRGLDIDCGCFGHKGAGETVAKAFVRDLFFMAWAMLLFLFLKKKK